MFIDGPRIITNFFYKKKIIKSMNVDISTLKNDFKKKIKKIIGTEDKYYNLIYEKTFRDRGSKFAV